MMELAFKIVHGYPKNIPKIYSNQLNNFIFRFIDKVPNNRPRLIHIEKYIPEELIELFEKGSITVKSDN